MNKMWFKRMLLKRRLAKLLKTTKVTPTSTPNRRLCESLLNLLDPSLFVDYLPDNGLCTIIKVRYKGIGEYTKKLKLTNILLKQKELIKPEWDNGFDRTVTLDRFLISADGFYVEHVGAITEFRNAGLELCALMAESDTAEFGEHNHNLRMLTKLLVNISGITMKLIEVSTQE